MVSVAVAARLAATGLATAQGVNQGGVKGSEADAVGKLWFQRADKDAPIPALLLKLLFTSEPSSIQVCPDDAFARSIDFPNGGSSKSKTS